LADLARSQPADIARAEIVRGAQAKPVSFRASAPLLAALDRLSAREHRTRANLIQYILWKYVREKS
jgi:predicted DNA-binding protein